MALLFVPMGSPVLAKGALLETGKRGYRPGSTAVARATFSSGYYDGNVSDGPYHAYLLPYGKRLDPGPIPRYAVPLGEIRIIPRGTGVWTAVIEFRVPRVNPRLYRLDYCNVPCSVWGLEELEAGSFTVLRTYRTPASARFKQAAELRAEAGDLGGVLGAGRDTEKQLAADLKRPRADAERSSVSPPLVGFIIIAGLAAPAVLLFSARTRSKCSGFVAVRSVSEQGAFK